MGDERINASSERDYSEMSANRIEECIAEFQQMWHGNFVMGFCGPNGTVRRGRTADMLRSLACRQNIQWSRVLIFLADERHGCETVDTNAHLVRSNLLEPLRKRRGFTFPEANFYVPDLSLSSLEACASDYQARLSALLEREVPAGAGTGTGGPHLMTAGLGEDGHILGFFPAWYQADPARWDEATKRKPRVLCTETAEYEVRHRICVNLWFFRKAQRIMLFLAEGRNQVWEAWESSGQGFKRQRNLETDIVKKAGIVRSISRSENGYFVLLGDDAQVTAKKDKPVHAPPSSPLSYVMKHATVTVVGHTLDLDNQYSFVILGAAGDLARKKTVPSLFKLHLGRYLPSSLAIFCCDDTSFHKDISSAEDLWELRLKKHLTSEACTARDLEDFRARIHFVPVSVSGVRALSGLDARIRELAGSRPVDNRVFYLALPSFLFATAVEHIRQDCWPGSGYCRVIVEKPFGRNGEEARELSTALARHLDESNIFRIDHYLAKTLVMNILTLRFANRELGRLFHADNVACVRIAFKEDIGVQGRAGYFDQYGIIRDILQNHILQVLTLLAMEAPASLLAEDVRDEKVKVLKQIRCIDPQDCVIGQYDGYQDDPDIKAINEDRGYPSRCPTFAVVVLYLDNERWSGVPFILKAGKGLEWSQTLVHLQFKKAPPGSLFGEQPQNELVIRIQPDEAIYYKILAKVPGLRNEERDVQQTVLELDVKKRFELHRTPEAYEKLIHDVLEGACHNFVRRDELELAWRIFDPLLRHMELEEERVPVRYALGSRGPREADALTHRIGFKRYNVTGVPGFAEDDVG
eukprot:NODE_660_length_2857_cov_14.498535.p1 GENE.NODE_660_length_2857_cov_14.498535~~NODE_660_length_2857_cov_14.498535.p1  ORF type:complete len:809 (-),score=205.63 NODE_660_length_2857_cov_14.498535:351-2777(-)